jgi:hypothetical protein
MYYFDAQGFMTDTDDPRLGIGDMLIESIGGGDRVISQFKGSGFDVVHAVLR